MENSTELNISFKEFDILATVAIKSSVFWDITLCSPMKNIDVSEVHLASFPRVEK
jgi:hypothetical protein